jgi:hypothetical protein
MAHWHNDKHHIITLLYADIIYIPESEIDTSLALVKIDSVAVFFYGK